MTLIRRPRTTWLKSLPMAALLTVFVDRRAFIWLLLGTVLVISQRTAPIWRSSHVYSTIRSSSSSSRSSTEQQLPQLNDSSNPMTTRNIIRVNATKRKYADSGRWMERYPFLPAVDDVADENRICFVHVGKTAGSTMACYLGFQYPACKDRMHLLPGKLPQWTTNLMHTHYDNCRYERFHWYLFTLRDPVTRMQSWFRYEYPLTDRVHDYGYKRVLFLDCDFASLEELAGPRGLGDMGKTICSRRAWWAIRGTVGFKNHNMYNFGYYYNQTNVQDPNARIAAIRTEYMEQDWINVENRLMGTPPISSSAFQTGFRHKNKSPAKAANKTDLSASALYYLCQALCEEIQVYKAILHRAENLQPDEVAQSLDELSQKCPTEAELVECPALKGPLTQKPTGPVYSYVKYPKAVADM